jgi:RNA ligase (TIGR02306 family)
MAYAAIVTRLKNVRPHSNADKVQLATCQGNQVVVGLDNNEDALGVYFPTDGQLSHEFCFANNLYRKAEMNKFPDERPGMFDENRRVRTQKFRGEISDGFWVPLHQFGFIQVTGLDVEGFEFTEWKGIPICDKYINPNTLKLARENQGKKLRTAKTSIMFKEHFDTAHFGKHVDEFKPGHRIVVTEKVHGTSGRVARVQVDKKLSRRDKIAKFFGANVEEKEWTYLNGTRRVVLEETSGTQYHDPTIRQKAFALFKDNLRKGETVFFEIVGYESTGAAIMPSVDTTKLGDKEFSKLFGKTMSYSYGCEPTEHKVYVYRITNTNEDGQSVDLTWDDVKNRCEELGVNHVPELFATSVEILAVMSKSKDDRDIYNLFEELINNAAKGASVLDVKHIREGVCVRIDNFGIVPKVYKHKSFEFKVLEGIVKDAGVVDMEESN